MNYPARTGFKRPRQNASTAANLRRKRARMNVRTGGNVGRYQRSPYTQNRMPREKSITMLLWLILKLVPLVLILALVYAS